jgi:hypothetical protein
MAASHEKVQEALASRYNDRYKGPPKRPKNTNENKDTIWYNGSPAVRNNHVFS